MEGFIGLLLLSGVEKSWDVPIRELYLDEKAITTYKATMSVNRFEDTRKMVRFDDRHTHESRSADDKLAGVHYVWELFLDKCRNRMIPTDLLTADEQLVPFRGRCSFTQYMPSKPAKYGIKIFWLCEATSAYASDRIVCTGRKPYEPIQKNVGLNVVKDLAKSIEESSKNITVDNFFTSVQLAEEMLQKQITVVGTIKQNKPEIPNEMKLSASRAIHSSLFAFRGDTTMVSYVPKMKKSVVLIGTMHHDRNIDETHAKKKPDIMKFYNSTKGGVDQMDQKICYYTCKRQTRRWPFALWVNMMDVAAMNSEILFSAQHLTYHSGSSDKRHLFLRDLAEEMVRPLMELRTQIPNLPKKIVDALQRCGVQKNVILPNQLPVSGKRCNYCPYNKHKKSDVTCIKCKTNICKEHSGVLCASCLSHVED
ncbi:piggyBac transposable element-derived protein 4-like [Schistocerca piceifrons]|uniref:piggyBac transposable element-derived protein 4-like n=1 Tax=Schistocerca piceifrons TaxID=274613 RepID=UPI001F5F1F2F|nr:piggyBac transposable element-derived protein 4-like [Schistocerca piceifrons]